MELKKTPLHAKHIELKARMAPFAGYDMPISYEESGGGMLKEHLAVRQQVGMFDVSHMGEFWLTGSEATKFLNHVCTRRFDKLAAGKAQYCLLLNSQGTIIDDIIVYKHSEDRYWIVVNASNIQKDFEHLKAQTQAFKVELQDVSEKTALIAVQGPKAAEIVEKILPGSNQLKYYQFQSPQKDWIVGRTGYTGEDGFEVFLPTNQASELWSELQKHSVMPIGLGARDTLRLEVGFALYGHELSDQLYPMETFSSFAVDLSADFVGSQGARKPPRYLTVALATDNPKPIRADDKIYLNGDLVGWITSGSTSPIKKVGIGLGLLNAEKLAKLSEKPRVFMLESGGKQRQSFSQDLPFVATARVKASKAKTL